MPDSGHDPRLATAAALPPTDLNPRSEAPLDFPDRELGELTPADYEALGFLCGVEVHQQLATGSKLFCRCPAGRRERKVDAEVLRHMRPTLSEMGEYDGCALMEFKTHKEIVYELSRSCVCTYEMDDTPPFEIDEHAVRIALEVARSFDLNLVAELHVMRKQYLDGSIPTGFQRTAMVGLGGVIPFSGSEIGQRELRVRQLSLEEDSCREVSDVGHRITFRTDRLGTPLIETVTEPDLRTPADAAAGVALLARIARSSGKVRRGPGAAREDVNVSIAGSRRVEIKGVPSWRLIPRLVHNEAYRHLNLLRIHAELARRGVTADALRIPAAGLPWEGTALAIDAGTGLRRCGFAPIADAIERGDTVAAVKLAGFGGLLGRRTQPGIPFARELEDRVRVIACLTARPFMIASNVEDYGPAPREWRQLRAALDARRGDAVVIVWGVERDVATAVREIAARAQEALAGVPSETRQPFRDGTTGFERILPGPQRMYPDTDTPPLPIPDAWVERIEVSRRELPWERERRYRDAGLTAPQARRLADAPWADLFDALAPAKSATARRIAAAFEKRFPLNRRRYAISLPHADRLRPLVRALDAAELHGDGCEQALDRLLMEREHGAEKIVGEHVATPREHERLADAITEAVELGAVLRMSSLEAAERWAMGRVLDRFRRGQVDPTRVRDLLRAARGLPEAG